MAQTKGKESIANANVPNEPLAFQGRATDRSAISGVGKCVDAAKTDRPAASANLQAKSKAQPEGATKMKTAEKGVERTRQNQPIQAKGSVAHEVSIVPPLFVRKDASGIIMGVGWTSDMLSGPDQPLNVRMRDPGVGLSGSEWAKIPYNFRLFPTDALARIWDFAYEPIIRKEVLEYKQQLKVAAKADQEMDWPNQLLIVLVDILEAELQEGAKHIVDASDIKTGESKTSTSDIISGYAGFLDIDLFIEAVYEIHNTLTDPSYNTTTAREALALSKGVKIDSHFTEILIELYEDLQPFELHSEMATTASDKERHDKKMLFLEQLENSFCKYKREESEQATGDATTGQVKGEEGEMLVEGSAVGKGKGKGRKKKRKSELLVDNAETDKGNGKGKERDMLVKGSTMGKGKSEDNDLKPDDAMTGKGKAKEKYVLVSKGKATELLMEGPTTEKCKCKENDLPMAGNTVSKEKCKDCNHHHHEAIMHHVYSDLLSEAKALFLDPKSIGFHKAMGLNAEADSTTSSAPTHVSYALRDLVQSPLTVQEETRLIAYYKMYDHMENFIRPQTATLAEVDRLCRLLLSPDFFAALTPLIGELTWNR